MSLSDLGFMAGGELWVGSAKGRKDHRCQQCRNMIKKGELMWRPITNSYNRWKRLCNECGTKEQAAQKRREEI